MGQFFRRKADDNRSAVRADVRFFRVEEIVQELLHLADIKLVAGLYSTVTREIRQGAMADHGLIGLFLVVEELADILQ